jgi:hypothetical protein
MVLVTMSNTTSPAPVLAQEDSAPYRGTVNGRLYSAPPDQNRSGTVQEVTETFTGEFDINPPRPLYAQVPLHLEVRTHNHYPGNPPTSPAQDCQGTWSGDELMQLQAQYDAGTAGYSISHIDMTLNAGTPVNETCSPPKQGLPPPSVPYNTLAFLDVAGQDPLELPMVDGAKIDVPKPARIPASDLTEWSLTIQVASVGD